MMKKIQIITIDRQWQQSGQRIDTELVILKNGITI
jgi:hypothetical protein